MAVQIYCDEDDIKAIIGEYGVSAAVDDDEDGAVAAPEDTYVGAAIERGAVEMNTYLRYQYSLTALATNEWCKWANATLAAYYIRTRRNNPAEQSLIDQVADIRRMLIEIRWGRLAIPGQVPAYDYRPTVSNFRPEIARKANPIRVVKDESTGPDPAAGVDRETSHQPGIN